MPDTASRPHHAPAPKTTHHFRLENHHPVVEVAQHLISPLTASLTIFFMHKRGQLPAMKAHLRSLWLRAQAARGGGGRPGGGGGLDAVTGRLHHHHPHATHEGSVAAAAAAAAAAGRAAAAGQVTPTAPPAAPKPHGRPLTAALAMGSSGAAAAAAGPGTATATTAADPATLAALTDAGSSAAAAAASPLPSHSLEVLQQLYPLEEARVVAEHLSHWPTVQFVERGLHWLHDTMHLPWWGTLVTATLLLRFALAPVNILLLRNTLRMKMLHPQVAALDARMQDPAATPAGRLAAARELGALFKGAGASPWTNALVFPVLLPPTILSIFGAIYNVSISTPAMATEGALWFPDLLVADSTNLLPVISAATWLLNVESGAGVYYHASARAKLVVRTAACMGWALSAPMPTGALLFWVTSNVFAICRGYVTRFDGVRRVLGIPLASQVAALSHLPKAVA